MEQPKYVLRFFFDYGSGVCLWSNSDLAYSRFNYPITMDKLPIPETVIQEGNRIIKWYDQSLDWDNPGGPLLWSEHEIAEFDKTVQAFINTLQEALGEDFLVIDQFRRLSDT